MSLLDVTSAECNLLPVFAVTVVKFPSNVSDFRFNLPFYVPRRIASIRFCKEGWLLKASSLGFKRAGLPIPGSF